jgi:hypothetical protein
MMTPTTAPVRAAVQAWLMMAQAAEQRGDFAAAEGWLGRIDDPKRALEVQTRLATLLARQGRVAEAREAVRRAPEREPGDARAKLVAEASVLREVKRWGDAFEVLGGAVQRFPGRPRPVVRAGHGRREDGPHGRHGAPAAPGHRDQARQRARHNALGYSLADRSLRLPEARAWCSGRSRSRRATPSSPTASAGSNTARAISTKRCACCARPTRRGRTSRSAPTWAKCSGRRPARRGAARLGRIEGPRRRQRRAAGNAGPAQGRPVILRAGAGGAVRVVAPGSRLLVGCATRPCGRCRHALDQRSLSVRVEATV